MSTYQISCAISTTNAAAALGFEIWVDHEKLFDTNHVDQELKLSFDLNEDEADHELRFVMKNKTDDNTTINEDGTITADACITISDVTFEDIALGQVFIDQAVYTHNFNGSQPEIKDKFYGEMGCNGVITLKYTTPIYPWLLESM